MRTIKFRGKRIDNGEWVYGFLCQVFVLTHDFGKCYIIDNSLASFHINNTPQCSFEVDPGTIGQFTGLTDKNGVEIYEGDLVHGVLRIEVPSETVKDYEKIEMVNDGVVVFEMGGFCFKNLLTEAELKEHHKYYPESDTDGIGGLYNYMPDKSEGADPNWTNEIEVTGNIQDKP